MPVPRDILLIGAGLGGLTAAIGLARAGCRVRVFEQSARLGEVGAGITMSSGAMRCFELLGLAAEVEAISSVSSSLPYLHYRSGELLRRGLGDRAPGARVRAARQVHRADLHALLLATLRHLAPDTIVLGRRFISMSQDEAGVVARFEGGETVAGALLVGCDGGRSAVRRDLLGDWPLEFAGQVAFRCLVPGELPAARVASRGGAVYVGPGATFNRYPLRGGALINCVGLVRTADWTDEGWNTPATHAEVLERFKDWHPELLGLIAAAPLQGLIKWGLFQRDPLPRWTAGRATLLGDAAHPMLPFLGLGAAMAIEDATVLGRAIAAHGDCGAALQRYEDARRPRATRIYRQSIEQGRLSQAVDPARYADAPAPAHDPSFFDYDPASIAL